MLQIELSILFFTSCNVNHVHLNVAQIHRQSVAGNEYLHSVHISRGWKFLIKVSTSSFFRISSRRNTSPENAPQMLPNPRAWPPPPPHANFSVVIAAWCAFCIQWTCIFLYRNVYLLSYNAFEIMFLFIAATCWHFNWNIFRFSFSFWTLLRRYAVERALCLVEFFSHLRIRCFTSFNRSSD